MLKEERINTTCMGSQIEQKPLLSGSGFDLFLVKSGQLEHLNLVSMGIMRPLHQIIDLCFRFLKSANVLTSGPLLDFVLSFC